MVRRSPRARDEFVLFNVVYQDGSLSSNRKVATSDLGDFGGDAAAIARIEAQDREIAERSGQARPPIKTISRALRK